MDTGACVIPSVKLAPTPRLEKSNWNFQLCLLKNILYISPDSSCDAQICLRFLSMLAQKRLHPPLNAYYKYTIISITRCEVSQQWELCVDRCAVCVVITTGGTTILRVGYKTMLRAEREEIFVCLFVPYL